MSPGLIERQHELAAKALAKWIPLDQRYELGDDLGTTPEGFERSIEERGILGMSVLWFERAADKGFIGSQDYRAQSAAMTLSTALLALTHICIPSRVVGWITGKAGLDEDGVREG